VRSSSPLRRRAVAGERNDRGISSSAAPALAAAVGENNLLQLGVMHPFSGEDFALFSREIRGAVFFVGVANAERGDLGAPHLPDFDADEEAISVATNAMGLVLWWRLSAQP
jgi:metal-dependent amidase/aminoacylase/carboxypeptidase family protein